MNIKIRDEIFQFEIFEPCSNRGYHVDGMIISSRTLQNYSPDEVLAELELMKSEGLVGHRGFGDEEISTRSWWSTRDGQIEKQKQLSKSGQVSSIMSRQRDFEVVDLVLALVVTPQSEMKLEKVGIYLYDCEPILIDQAVQKLLDDGYISKVDYGFGDALSGTVKGVVHCNR